jgi:hypothetical protein
MSEHRLSEAGQKILHWIRAGQPEGLPREDYIPIYGLLHRKLTVVEIDEITHSLLEDGYADDGVITEDEIREVVEDKAYENATEEDIARIEAKLAAMGWPLDAH